MIVSKDYSHRYDAALKSNSRKFLASMGSTEFNLYCRTGKRKSKCGNHKPSNEDKIIATKNIIIKKTQNSGAKSTSTLSTCMRSKSKRLTSEYFQPNSTIQPKKTI
jgi:hypothetical protein